MNFDLEETEDPRRWFARGLGILILGVGLTVGAVGVWMYAHQRELLARRAMDTLATKACFESRVISEWRARCEVCLDGLRRQPGIPGYLRGSAPFPEEAFRGALREGAFAAVCLTDATGRPLRGTACGNPAFEGDMGPPPGRVLTMEAPAYRIVVSRDGSPAVACWVRLPEPDATDPRLPGGQVLVRAISLREPFVTSSLRAWTYYATERLDLCQMGRGGVCLVRLAPSPQILSSEETDPGRAATLAVTGEIVQGQERGPGGEARLFATFFEPVTGWGVIARMDAAEALETLRPTFLLLGSLELAVLLLMGAGLLLLARRRHMNLLNRSHATLESLLGRLLASQERERAAVSADLHDGICQILQAAETQAARAERGAGNPDARTAAGEARKQIGDAARATRTLIAGLGPPALRRIGLVAALEDLASGGSGAPVPQVRISCGPEADALPAETREHLFRIAQEALQNARKHSGAASVAVVLEKREGAIHLEIRDDGRGFSVKPGEPLARHFGLGIMRQRARDMGATLKVETGPEGTRVRVRLPVPPGDGSPSPGGRDSIP